jgi:cyclic pyranopterin phosphate synthase
MVPRPSETPGERAPDDAPIQLPDAHTGQEPGRPDDPRLLDTFGRVAKDLRVSLTDRCNLRCSYCMPPEGLPWLPNEELLTDDEVIRLITVAVQQLGITEIRFTGGEPLLRRGLESIIAATSALQTMDGNVPETALTTNGIGLVERAGTLAAAGLTRINVSLDSLDPERFARIAHRNRHAEVIAGLAVAASTSLAPIKVNTVLMRGVNDDEAVPLLRWALDHGYHLRFIEQMPLDPHGAWLREEILTVDDVLHRVGEGFRLVPVPNADRGSAPAESWWVHELPAPNGKPANGERPDGELPDAAAALGRVGVIGSVTRSFCAACDRTRLTSDGQVRNCLFASSETDLRALLRAGASDQDLADAWREAMWGKAAGHGIGTPLFLRPNRPMSAIGG